MYSTYVPMSEDKFSTLFVSCMLLLYHKAFRSNYFQQRVLNCLYYIPDTCVLLLYSGKGRTTPKNR